MSEPVSRYVCGSHFSRSSWIRCSIACQFCWAECLYCILSAHLWSCESASGLWYPSVPVSYWKFPSSRPVSVWLSVKYSSDRPCCWLFQEYGSSLWRWQPVEWLRFEPLPWLLSPVSDIVSETHNCAFRPHNSPDKVTVLRWPDSLYGVWRVPLWIWLLLYLSYIWGFIVCYLSTGLHRLFSDWWFLHTVVCVWYWCAPRVLIQYKGQHQE